MQGNLGDAIRIRKIAAHIRALGHEVRLCNAADYRLPRRKLLRRPAVLARLARHALTDRATASYEAYRRLLSEVLDEQLAAFAADAVVAEGILQAGLVAGHCVKRNVPLVTDVHGLASAEYEENPFHAVNAKKAAFLHRVESDAFIRSAQVWSVSTPMQDYVVRHGGTRAATPIVRNGADVQNQTARFGDRPFRVGYGGILAFWEDVDAFLDLAASDRSRPGLELHLAGNGPLAEHVHGRIRDEKLPVTDHGRLARDASLSFFAGLQAGIAPSVDALTRRVACPIKVFDYLACGLPVITPALGEWADIVEAEDAGIVTKRSRAEEFAESVETIRNERAWKEKAANAKAAIAKRYNWKAVLEPIGESLLEATKR